MEVRKAEKRDQDVLVDFCIRFAAESKNLVVEREIAVAGVSHLLDTPSEGLYYIAEIDGKPIGYMMVFLEWSDWRGGDFHYIDAAYTVPEHRSQGVFKKLYEKAYQDAEISGSALRTIVEGNNPATIKRYTDLGMQDSHYTVLEVMFRP